eukprot:222709_1
MKSIITTVIGIIAVLIGIGYVKQKELFKFFVHNNFQKFKFGTVCLMNIETNSFIRFQNHVKGTLSLDEHDPLQNCDAILRFNNILNEEEFYRTMVLHGGGTGLGETYMNNIWTTHDQDLGDVIYHLLFNAVHNNGSPLYEYLLSFNHWYYTFKRKYLISKSKEEDIESISHHYDLDNKFYQLFLGAQLSGYSCGFFNQYSDTIFDAQNNKWNMIINKIASLLPNKLQSMNNKHKIIDIGSGWGYFPSYVNNKTNSTAYGITISKQQYEFSVKNYDTQIKKGDVKFELLDYRDLGEKYAGFF